MKDKIKPIVILKLSNKSSIWDYVSEIVRVDAWGCLWMPIRLSVDCVWGGIKHNSFSELVKMSRLAKTSKSSIWTSV